MNQDQDTSTAAAASNALEQVTLPVQSALGCASVAAIGKLGTPLLKAIADRTSPQVIAPLFKEMKRISKDVLEELMARADTVKEDEFWEEARKLAVIIDANAVDTLHAEDERTLEDTDDSTYLAELYQNKPERLAEMLVRVVEGRIGEVKGKSFHVYRSSFAVPVTKQKLLSVSPEKILFALRGDFEKRRYGSTPTISRIGGDGNWGLVVNRGDRRAPEAIYDVFEQPQVTLDRKAKTDMMIFVEEANTLWVAPAKKTDAPMYASAVGHVMDGREVFVQKVEANMAVFLEPDLGKKLEEIATTLAVVRAEMRAVDIEKATGGVFRQRCKPNEPCFTKRPTLPEELNPANLMRGTTIRIVHDVKGKVFAELDIKPGSIKIKGRMTPATANTIMTLLGAWRGYENA